MACSFPLLKDKGYQEQLSKALDKAQIIYHILMAVKASLGAADHPGAATLAAHADGFRPARIVIRTGPPFMASRNR
jgi:hypothetical protein